jgi:hypothetical protein
LSFYSFFVSFKPNGKGLKKANQPQGPKLPLCQEKQKKKQKKLVFSCLSGGRGGGPREEGLCEGPCEWVAV